MKYICNMCNYESGNLFNYNKHLKTRKHCKNFSKIRDQYSETGEMFSKIRDKKNASCVYCKMIFKHKKNISRHYKTCKKKKKHDIEKEIVNMELKKEKIISKLVKTNKKIKKKKKKIKADKKRIEKEKMLIELEKQELASHLRCSYNDLRSLEREYFDFMKKASIRTKIKNKNVYNMYYIINNFNDAYDFKTLMNAPMTETEKDELYKLGPNHGCIKYIKKRCIDGISIDKRPIHCVDSSRNKYLLRENGCWVIDNNAKYILKEAYEKIKDVYLVKLNNMNGVNIDEINNKMKQLLIIESKGRIQVLGILNDLVLLKNNINML